MEPQQNNGLEVLAQIGATPDIIVREQGRKAITGLCRTAWWMREKEGTVPQRVSLGKRAVGWRLSELQAWVRGQWRSEVAQ